MAEQPTNGNGSVGSSGGVTTRRKPVDRVEHPEQHAAQAGSSQFTELERSLLGDIFAIVEEHADDSVVQIDRERVEQAFLFACEHHADQRRKSGEEFIVHPVGVAKICAGLRLDTETLCRSEEHTSELQSRQYLVCRLL